MKVQELIEILQELEEETPGMDVFVLDTERGTGPPLVFEHEREFPHYPKGDTEFFVVLEGGE